MGAKQIVKNIADDYIRKKLIRITEGKKVIEIRPQKDWNKGKAVRWILNEQKDHNNKNVLPVYIGDDQTDEDAFKAIRKNGLTIYVGRNAKTTAQYRLNDTKELQCFLEDLLKMKRGEVL